MSEIEITQNHFKYGGRKYFRTKAEDVELSSFGEKKTPFGSGAYLAVENRLTVENAARAKVRQTTVATIDWSQYSKTDVEVNGNVKYFAVGGSVAFNGSYSKAKSARLKLVKFVFDEGPLKKTLNQHAGRALNYLKTEGRDGRFVHEVWVAMEAELANHFENSTSIEVAGQGSASLTVEAKTTVGSSSTKTESINLSAGTCFAYAMVKVKKWNRGKTEIEDLEDDYSGLT